MQNKGEQINFTAEDGEEVAFYVLEQTRLNGINYLLVADTMEDDEEANALILKDISLDGDLEALYEIVEDETELVAVSKIFEEILDDIDIDIEMN